MLQVKLENQAARKIPFSTVSILISLEGEDFNLVATLACEQSFAMVRISCAAEMPISLKRKGQTKKITMKA